MGKKGQSDFFRFKTFLRGLQDAADALPTESEKQEIQSKCARLIEFLTGLQTTIRALPSSDDLTEVRRSIQAIEGLFLKAQNDPVLAVAVGLKQPRTSKQAARPLSEEESEKAKGTLAHLESLPIDAIQSKLQDETSYSSRELHAVASLLGIKATKSVNREALIHQITTKIANYRGYQGLRGKEEEAGS